MANAVRAYKMISSRLWEERDCTHRWPGYGGHSPSFTRRRLGTGQRPVL